MHRTNMHRNSISSSTNPTMRPASGGKSLVTFSTYKERQDILKNTMVMAYEEDTRADINTSADAKIYNTTSGNGNIIAPQPIASVGSRTAPLESNEFLDNSQQRNLKISADERVYPASQKPPDSPVPDYDYVQFRGTIPKELRSRNVTSANSQSINSQSSVTGNRRTMRLGTVTIGEYTGAQDQRKEPAKFGFLPQKKANEEQSSYTSPKPTNLHSELQNTLSRSNLKKTGINTSEPMVHQSHCQQHNSYENGFLANENANEYTNVEKLTRMLQCKQNPMESPVRPQSIHGVRKSTSANQNDEHVAMQHEYTGTGILKKVSCNRSTRSSFSKNAEKSISFGN